MCVVPSCPSAWNSTFFRNARLQVPAVDPNSGHSTAAMLAAAGLLAGVSTLSSDSPDASLVIRALDAGYRTIFDPFSSSWIVHRSQPCFVKTWGGQVSSATEDTIVVSSPPWQGINSLVVSLGLSNSTDFASSAFRLSYESPQLRAVTPGVGQTNGQVVTLLGSYVHLA